MKIIVKSIPEYYEKEKNGTKPNTVRKLDGNDTIEVHNTETGDKFERKLTDLTEYKGTIIFSWRPEVKQDVR